MATKETELPKITIVTPSYNQGHYLEQTILSVLDQDYPNLEYMVIDGGSQDQSVEIMKKYAGRLAYSVSEKDAGQSDAINKGLKRATGHLFNWLNSDDCLEPGALKKLAKDYMENRDKKVFCYGLVYLQNDQKQPVLSNNNVHDDLQCLSDPVIKQPATFYTIDAIQAFGGLSTQLHYAMDYEWWIKCMLMFGVPSIHIDDHVAAAFRLHEEAKTAQGQHLFLNDIASILHSLLQQHNLNAFAGLLALGYNIKPQYTFSVQTSPSQKGMVQHMAAYFILKWNCVPLTKQQFDYAKKAVRQIKQLDLSWSEKEQALMKRMESNTKAPGWFFWRAYKKLGLIK